MHDILALKTCRDCSRKLPLDQFHKNKECRDGLRPECRECVKAYRAKYYKKNRTELIDYSKQFYAENAGHVKTYQERYRQRNPDKIANRTKVWRVKNRERLLGEKRKHYIANHEKYLEMGRAYSKQHPEYGRLSSYRRKARIRAATGNCTGAQWLAKCEYFGWRCYLCHTSLTIQTLHMDHRTPIARGGSNWPSNLAPACGPCNLSKSHKTEKEYREQNP